MNDMWKMVLVVVVICLILVGFGVGGYALISSNACLNYANMELQAKYSFWTGCMIKDSKLGWLPSEQYFNHISLEVVPQ
jgi:hypothetical protein